MPVASQATVGDQDLRDCHLGPLFLPLAPQIIQVVDDHDNNVLLVKIEGPVWLIPSIIIYLLCFFKPLCSSTNQWEFGTSMDLVLVNLGRLL